MATVTTAPKPPSAVDEFRDQVRLQMEKREVTISQLAREIGMSRAYLSRVLAGQKKLSLDVASRIAEHVGLQIKTELV